MKIVKTPAGRSRKKPARTYAYPYEYRLRVVRLHLEEGYSRPLLAEQFGISTHSIQRWVKAYREHGADGLHPKPRSGGSGRRVAPEIRQRILDVKTSQPQYGPRRIADVLKRFFFLRTSPSTAHRTLAARGLTQKRRSKPVKNPSKPRFFERARPNQMWQSDIMTFRLAGRNAYLIGYLDDYSRYITALGLYRSQTAEHVIETHLIEVQAGSAEGKRTSGPAYRRRHRARARHALHRPRHLVLGRSGRSGPRTVPRRREILPPDDGKDDAAEAPADWGSDQGVDAPPGARPADDKHGAGGTAGVTTLDRDAARAILARYDVAYIYVGPVERERYPAEGLAKFAEMFPAVYANDAVTIYAAGR